MEKEVVCYIYSFSVDLYNGRKTFYFENKDDAEISRFVVYKSFDKKRLSIKGFNLPVTKPAKHMIKENDLNNKKILTSYDDFVNEWYKITEKMCEEGISV